MALFRLAALSAATALPKGRPQPFRVGPFEEPVRSASYVHAAPLDSTARRRGSEEGAGHGRTGTLEGTQFQRTLGTVLFIHLDVVAVADCGVIQASQDVSNFERPAVMPLMLFCIRLDPRPRSLSPSDGNFESAKSSTYL